jgi:enoyl-CoA hydratase/carnithine racemase
MTDLVIVSDDGPIRTVRMNRPDKKNALTVPMYDAMAAAIENAAGAAHLAPSAPATTCRISCLRSRMPKA